MSETLPIPFPQDSTSFDVVSKETYLNFKARQVETSISTRLIKPHNFCRGVMEMQPFTFLTHKIDGVISKETMSALLKCSEHTSAFVVDDSKHFMSYSVEKDQRSQYFLKKSVALSCPFQKDNGFFFEGNSIQHAFLEEIRLKMTPNVASISAKLRDIAIFPPRTCFTQHVDQITSSNHFGSLYVFLPVESALFDLFSVQILSETDYGDVFVKYEPHKFTNANQSAWIGMYTDTKKSFHASKTTTTVAICYDLMMDDVGGVLESINTDFVRDMQQILCQRSLGMQCEHLYPDKTLNPKFLKGSDFDVYHNLVQSGKFDVSLVPLMHKDVVDDKMISTQQVTFGTIPEEKLSYVIAQKQSKLLISQRNGSLGTNGRNLYRFGFIIQQKDAQNQKVSNDDIASLDLLNLFNIIWNPGKNYFNSIDHLLGQTDLINFCNGRLTKLFSILKFYFAHNEDLFRIHDTIKFIIDALALRFLWWTKQNIYYEKLSQEWINFFGILGKVDQGESYDLLDKIHPNIYLDIDTLLTGALNDKIEEIATNGGYQEIHVTDNFVELFIYEFQSKQETRRARNLVRFLLERHAINHTVDLMKPNYDAIAPVEAAIRICATLMDESTSKSDFLYLLGLLMKITPVDYNMDTLFHRSCTVLAASMIDRDEEDIITTLLECPDETVSIVFHFFIGAQLHRRVPNIKLGDFKKVVSHANVLLLTLLYMERYDDNEAGEILKMCLKVGHSCTSQFITNFLVQNGDSRIFLGDSDFTSTLLQYDVYLPLVLEQVMESIDHHDEIFLDNHFENQIADRYVALNWMEKLKGFDFENGVISYPFWRRIMTGYYRKILRKENVNPTQIKYLLDYLKKFFKHEQDWCRIPSKAEITQNFPESSEKFNDLFIQWLHKVKEGHSGHFVLSFDEMRLNEALVSTCLDIFKYHAIGGLVKLVFTEFDDEEFVIYVSGWPVWEYFRYFHDLQLVFESFMDSKK